MISCANPNYVVKFRKTDGKKYGEGVANFRDSEFPFPVQPEAALSPVQEELGVAGEPSAGVEGRCEASYVQQIAELQARLHAATSQLELANVVCVGQVDELDELKSERRESVVKVMHLKSENAVLKRRINNLEPGEGVKLPRPGPSLKPFEDLTPRQQKVASDDLQSRVLTTSEERGILPSKLSAYLTYR